MSFLAGGATRADIPGGAFSELEKYFFQNLVDDVITLLLFLLYLRVTIVQIH